MISLIKQGQVDTIYTFDQSRLFKDAYEGNCFNEFQKKYGFNVFFTKDNQLMSDPNMDEEQNFNNSKEKIDGHVFQYLLMT